MERKISRQNLLFELNNAIMGRFYAGDIQGKIMHYQSSNGADRFGVEGYVEYYFETDHLEQVEEEIEKIEEELNDENIELLDDWFATHDSLNFEELGFSEEEMCDYADLVMGRKIRDCIKKQGDCRFVADILDYH